MNDILKRFCWLDDKMTAGGHFIVLALSWPSAIVLGVVGALAPEHLLVRLADQLS